MSVCVCVIITVFMVMFFGLYVFYILVGWLVGYDLVFSDSGPYKIIF
jgi:hypothetical protein